MAGLSPLSGRVLMSQAFSNRLFGQDSPASQPWGIDRKSGDIGETDRHISDKRGKLESCLTIDQKDSHEIDLGYCDRRLRGV
jgi:hypothetical protein